MKPVLVAGASNQIAAFLLPRLLSGRAQVCAVARQPQPDWIQSRPGLSWRQADLSTPAGLPQQAQLVWLAPMALLPGALRQLQPARVVLVSSTSRLSKRDSKDQAERAVADTLGQGEAALQHWCEQNTVEYTILRPTLIYGAGLDQNLTRIARLIERYGFAVIAGRGQGLRQPVHADDVAAAIVRVLDESRSFGRDYNLSGGSTLSYQDMVGAVFRSLGRRSRIINVPGWLLEPLAALAGRLPAWRGLSGAVVARMEQDLVFDHAPATLDFGYQPRPFMPTGMTWQLLGQTDSDQPTDPD